MNSVHLYSISVFLPDRFPTKQGLKLYFGCGLMLRVLLPDRFPTKQGLKLAWDRFAALKSRTPRPISNKTRIETTLAVGCERSSPKLPDRFPTKQGLKRKPQTDLTNAYALPDRFPTKQGLKLILERLRDEADYISQTDFQQNKD